MGGNVIVTDLCPRGRECDCDWPMSPWELRAQEEKVLISFSLTISILYITSVVFQLRTGHAPVNGRLHRTDPARNPNCRHSHTNMETVQHLLLHCSQLSELRHQLLPSQPNIHNTLYTSSTQLRNTTLFARRAMGC
jgi:hypothetical protein